MMGDGADDARDQEERELLSGIDLVDKPNEELTEYQRQLKAAYIEHGRRIMNMAEKTKMRFYLKPEVRISKTERDELALFMESEHDASLEMVMVLGFETAKKIAGLMLETMESPYAIGGRVGRRYEHDRS